MSDLINNPYETIKVIEAWGFEEDFYIGNLLKYVSRFPHKGNPLQDLKKAAWYLNRKIEKLEKNERMV